MSKLLFCLLPLLVMVAVIPAALAEAPATVHGLAPMAGDQRVQRRRQSQCGSIRRDIMDAAIRDENGAGHTVGWHIGEGGR